MLDRMSVVAEKYCMLLSSCFTCFLVDAYRVGSAVLEK